VQALGEARLHYHVECVHVVLVPQWMEGGLKVSPCTVGQRGQRARHALRRRDAA